MMALAKNATESSVGKKNKRVAKVQSTDALGHAFMHKQV